MALFETKVTFKTYELLCDMLELSNYNFNRFSRNHNYVSGHVYEHIPKFTLGRQTGKTDAVLKYISECEEKNLLVIVPNRNMKNYYIEKLKDCTNKTIFVVCEPLCNSDTFMGIDLSGYTIIFDELTSNHVHNVLQFLGPVIKDITSMKMVAIIS